ncbi:MAG: archaemetzincin family Zn-dependent metalloprotease [Bacteroidales bacterium]|nr:archaemetzincin family Zn-dependent metalloprotease [Bacteroidales bacterium]
MNQPSIILIPFGYFENDFLKKIADDVGREYLLPVRIRDGHLDLSEFHDPVRRQYNGNALLKVVDSQFSAGSLKTLGLFSVDISIPILTYIFGQAYLNGRTGIASLYRFNNERYGMKKDEQLLLDRFRKEVIHELGHTFGLIHCHVPDCVMRSSTYVEDIDQKSAHLCFRCRETLGSSTELTNMPSN